MSLGTLDLTNDKLAASNIYNYRLNNSVMTYNIKNYASSSFSSCSILGDNFFGMLFFTTNTTVTKSVYNLAPHQWTRIRLQVVAVDDWENVSIKLTVDQISGYNETYILNPQDISNITFDNSRLLKDFCQRNNYADGLATFDVSITHYESMIKLRVSTNGPQFD